MNNYEIIGTRLKEARELRDYSLEEVSTIIKISKSTLSRYENGLVENMKLPVLKSLSEIYRVNYLWLLGKSNDRDEFKIIATQFNTPQEAMEFLLNQQVVMGFNGLDINNLSEQDQIDYANEVLNMMQLVSLKYKGKK
ncbi:helix-turn-helix domain-containing protein [Helcococcus kunzii]|uniref:helix-turn-helix domain-containing protein n=1 Tax=Helcococcus kunzii TaxID=40091 RepID=UPI0038B213D0